MTEIKQLIKEIISEFHITGIPDLIERKTQVPNFKKINKIITIIGPRRAGKTYFLYQIMKELKIPLNEILYLNFADERIKNIKQDELQLILDAYGELYPNYKPTIFFDEIQEVSDWDLFVLRLQNQKYTIYITGSNSRMLSVEIATQLRGRTYTVEILPFSFSEYLFFKNINLNKNWEHTKMKYIVKKEFENYINLSGYPECVIENKLIFLNDYYKAIIFRDIIERYNIKDTHGLDFVMKYLTNNYASLFSLYKLFNFSKTMQINLGMGSIQKYSKALEDVYFLMILNKYSKSIKKKLQNPSKAYLFDHGYINFLNSNVDKGRLIENIVAIELRRKNKIITYYKEVNECDFIIENHTPLQVTWELNKNNEKREYVGLIEAMNYLNVKQGLILTYDQEDSKDIDGKKIRIIPLWKWLLE